MAQNDRVGDAYIDIKPNGNGFNSGVQAIINQAEKTATFKVSASTTAAQQQVEQLGRKIQEDIGGSLAQSAVQAAAFTASIFAIRGALEGVVGKFSELFDGIAKAKAGFDAILGERAGGQLLQEVRQFAIDSPFVTSELVQYSQQLLGVGKAANTIVPTLKSVGDIVASVGGDTSNLGSILYALTQIQTIGKLTGQDARQLQNQLVPITKYIAEYTKQSVADVKKLQEAGGISSDIVFAAIENQGKKVEGALNDSVRTIAGAKSVLDDTLRNFFQSNEGLKKIYQDLVSGIQAVATAVSDPKVTDAIERAISSIAKVYEALKPTIKAFIDFASSTGLTGLSVFTHTLETLATILNAFPAPVLELVGQALGVIAVLKAPTALIQYVNNISKLANGILGGGLLNGLRRMTVETETMAVANVEAATASQRAASAAVQQAESYSLLSAEFKKVIVDAERATIAFGEVGVASAGAGSGAVGKRGGGAGKGLAALGLTLGGSLLTENTSKTNSATQTLGTAATFAGYGALLGPEGAIIGAGIGALVGYFNAQDAKFKEQIAKAKKAGEDTATAYVEANSAVFNTVNAEGAQKISDKLDELTKKQKELDDKRKGIVDVITPTSFVFGGGNELQNKIDRAGLKIQSAEVQGEITKTKEVYDKTAQSILDIAAAAEKAGKTNFYKDDGHVAGIAIRTAKSFQELDAEFRKYGVTSAEAVSLGADAFTQLVEQIDSLDTAQKAATVSANLLSAALVDAAGKGKAIYGTEISNIGSQISTLNAVKGAKDAASASAVQPGNGLLKAQADQALSQAKLAVFTAEYASSQIKSQQAIDKAVKEGNDVLAGLLKTNKDKVAQDAAEAAATKLVADVYDAQTDAIYRNTRAREEAVKSQDLALAQSQLSGLTATDQARQAAGVAAINPRDPEAQLQAKIALGQAQIAAGNAAAAKASQGTRNAIDVLIAGGAALDSEIIKLLNSTVAAQEAIAKTAAAEDVATEAAHAAAIARLGNAALIQSQTDATIEKFLTLAGLADSIDNRQLVISILTPDIQQAIAQLQSVQLEIDRLSETSNPNQRLLNELRYERDQLKSQIATGGAGTNQSEADKLKFAAAVRDADKKAADMQKWLEAIAKNQKDAEDALKKWQDTVTSATERLTDKLQGSADAIAAAAKTWVGSITERTKYESAVSVTSLTRNATKQAADAAELATDLAKLRARGLTENVIDALDFNNIADLKQVRKLVNASSGQLNALNNAVGNRDAAALDLATAAEQKQQHDVIVSAIKDAAKELGFDPKKVDAEGIANQFNITSTLDANAIALQILSVLSGGKIG